jgi:hypothetical protein
MDKMKYTTIEDTSGGLIARDACERTPPKTQ